MPSVPGLDLREVEQVEISIDEEPLPAVVEAQVIHAKDDVAIRWAHPERDRPEDVARGISPMVEEEQINSHGS